MNINYEQAIIDVKTALEYLTTIRDRMSRGDNISHDDMAKIQLDYEILVRNSVEVLNMHEPYEKEIHGRVYKCENPAEFAAKAGSLFSLNLGINFL